MKAGFVVRYVPIVLAKGLCPDTIGGFMVQQYRWCTGSMSLLLDRGFHAASGIHATQRMCFWAGFLYYISTAVNAVVAPLPALAMLIFAPTWVHPGNSVWLLGAISLWVVVLPTVMQGRWRLDVLRVQVLYSFAHAVAIAHAVTGRTQEWVATGSANTRTTPLAVTIGRVAKTYIGIAYGTLWLTLIFRTIQCGLDDYWAMIALTCCATYVTAPILWADTASQSRPAIALPAASELMTQGTELISQAGSTPSMETA
jgi:cellulose synthase (UDP-forming)